MQEPSRPNTTLAALIERCIAMAATGQTGAVAAMVAAGVPDRVIARALREPHRRRTTGTPQ